MTTHDPLCNLPPEITDCPTCDWIARARADERARMRDTYHMEERVVRRPDRRGGEAMSDLADLRAKVKALPTTECTARVKTCGGVEVTTVRRKSLPQFRADVLALFDGEKP